MPDSKDVTQPPASKELTTELVERIHALVHALVTRSEDKIEAEYVHLLARVNGLVERKLRMEGSKTDTRDFLAEMLFTRLRRGMRSFLRSEEEATAQRAAECVMGLLFSVTTLSEFAKAFDESLFRQHAGVGGKDFNFAGRTDFISVEEVMQMLAAGKHLGCLSLEKGDNRLDIYLDEGRIFFLDPHHLARRVLPGDAMRHREIPEAAVTEAQGRHAQENVPILVTLVERGIFQGAEQAEVMRQFGKEVLFEFMREQKPYAFYYRKLDALPAFAVDNDLRLGVTSILLEGSKLVDDWKQMLTVFPDPDAPIEPKSDMYARMGDLALGVLEIKLLSLVDGENSPRAMVGALGLPLYDVYVMMIRLAKEGILTTSGDVDALQGIEFESVQSSVDESMQEAFAALDANDDDSQRRSAIDRVFGDDDGAGADGNPLSALDRVLGADQREPESKPDLDQGLLGILRKNT